MLRTPIAACFIALTLAAAPATAQTPPGPTPPTPQQQGATGGGPAQPAAPGAQSTQGKVVGTPQDPGGTDAQRGASFVPLFWLSLVALGGGVALWQFLRRRRRSG